MKPTQTNDVLMHLKEHGTITTNEANELYGATRLGDIILRLRKHHIIETIMEDFQKNGISGTQDILWKSIERYVK